MAHQCVVRTHGDPLGAVRKVVRHVWERANLDGILVPTADLEDGRRALKVLERPLQLAGINPFRPLARMSVARLLPRALDGHEGENLGVILRPCEMRELARMGVPDTLESRSLVSICVDCLGTLPVDEYRRRQRSREEEVAWDARPSAAPPQLRPPAASPGVDAPDGRRLPSQTCAAPAAEGGDVNIAVLGLPVRERILVDFGPRLVAAGLLASDLCDEVAAERDASARAELLGRRAEQYARAASLAASCCPEHILA